MENAVIMPVYNEAGTLPGVLRRVRRFHQGPIIAIDDGSVDGSGQILRDFGGLDVIRHEKNMGYGKSLIDGFARAIELKSPLAVTIDCDEQHEPCLIPAMFAGIGSLDILSGSRYLADEEGQDAPPENRLRINKSVTTIINRLTGFGLTDSFCGFKCHKMEAMARLKLDESGYALPIQFWVQVRHFGLTVGEIPVPRIYKNRSRAFGGGIDDPEKRYDYYMAVLEKELKRWSTSSSSAPTPTI
jgi:dolichol-phosphate mannosyltransferase